MSRRQQGFAALETVLILVVVGIIGFTGWYVWHSKQAADNAITKTDAKNITGTEVATLSDACTTSAPDMNGKLFTAADGSYSFCMPNGWVLDGAGSLATWFWQSQEQPTYKKGTEPQLLPGGGGDGIKPLFISSFTSTEKPKGTVNDFSEVGHLKTTNMAGTEYYGKQTKQPPDGLGSAEIGTIEYLYVLTDSKGRSVSFDYFVSPGEHDNSAQVKSVVLTTLNKDI